MDGTEDASQHLALREALVDYIWTAKGGQGVEESDGDDF